MYTAMTELLNTSHKTKKEKKANAPLAVIELEVTEPNLKTRKRFLKTFKVNSSIPMSIEDTKISFKASCHSKMKLA